LECHGIQVAQVRAKYGTNRRPIQPLCIIVSVDNSEAPRSSIPGKIIDCRDHSISTIALNESEPFSKTLVKQNPMYDLQIAVSLDCNYRQVIHRYGMHVAPFD
jgi:hypothetical protein